MNKEKVTKVIRFIVSGGTVAFIVVSLLHIFTEWLHIWYLLSSVLANIIGIIVNFCLQKFWTFKNRDKNVRTQGGLFFVNSLLNLVLNTALMYSMVDILGIHYILAQALTMILLSVMNFFIYQMIIFRQKEEVIERSE